MVESTTGSENYLRHTLRKIKRFILKNDSVASIPNTPTASQPHYVPLK